MRLLKIVKDYCFQGKHSIKKKQSERTEHFLQKKRDLH